MRLLVLLASGKYRKRNLSLSLTHNTYYSTYFYSKKKMNFCKKITPIKDVIILFASEMSVFPIALEEQFLLKIPFPRCGVRRNQQL